MKNVLHIISSARDENSYSKGLSSAIVEKLKDQHFVSTLVERNLAVDFPFFIDGKLIYEFYKHPSQVDEQGAALLSYANTIFEEVEKADIIVIGTPMHNLGISAPLKAWIDQLVRMGKSYGFTDDGQRAGYLGGKQIYVAIASGGKKNGASGENDYIESYLRDVFKAYTGITDVACFRVEGTAFPHFEVDYNQIIENL